MATPVVNVSFTAAPRTGEPPLTVDFTDTTEVTDGYARQWFWDFGDGSVSEDQNPTHIYEGVGGEKFTVSLMVLATEGEFSALSSNTVQASRISNDRLQGVDFTPEDAWAARTNAPLATGKVQHSLGYNGSQYFYTTNTPLLSINTGQSDPVFSMLMTEWSIFDNDYMTLTGQIDFNGNVSSTGINGQKHPHGRLTNPVTDPLIATAFIFPQIQLASPTAGLNVGMVVSMFRRTYTNTATQSFGEHEEVDYIQIGDPPIADFTGSPLVGGSPLFVQFENLTIPATGGVPTTYVWKKRLSGSGNPFETFSTAENPLEIFTK